MRQKWYNDCVVRATERPYRSGTGGVIVAHPAIVQTALQNCKHDVQTKYWSYFKANGMFVSCALLWGAFSHSCIRFGPDQGFV